MVLISVINISLSLFGHIARLDDSADAKKILTARRLEETARSPSDHMDEDSTKMTLSSIISH